MTENTFTPVAGDANIAAYEDITLANAHQPEEAPPDKIKNVLVRTIFIAKCVTWIGLSLGIILGLYNWTRNQAQDGLLMKLNANTNESILCQWMSHGMSTGLNRNDDFRAFLRENNETTITGLIDNQHCVAPDTAIKWLTLDKEYQSTQLASAYGEIIPKKFLSTTIETLPELKLIQEKSPDHRTHHDEVIKIVSNIAKSASESAAKVSCFEIRFEGLNARIQCEVRSKPPLLPRKKALDFMKALEKTESILVTYPETLDMKADDKTNTLTTDFELNITYIPARYEPERIEKLTYDKR